MQKNYKEVCDDPTRTTASTLAAARTQAADIDR